MLPSTRLHVARGLFHLTPQSAALYAVAACVQKWEPATMHTNRHRVQRPLHWIVRPFSLAEHLKSFPYDLANQLCQILTLNCYFH